MPDQATEASQPTSSHSLPPLSLAALGVVFGDIGTSPLYALKAVLDVTTENPPTEILGALSLIVWTLIIITSVKYITLAMRVDKDGEGGILALMALLRMRNVRQALVVFIVCSAPRGYMAIPQSRPQSRCRRPFSRRVETVATLLLDGMWRHRLVPSKLGLEVTAKMASP